MFPGGKGEGLVIRGQNGGHGVFCGQDGGHAAKRTRENGDYGTKNRTFVDKIAVMLQKGHGKNGNYDMKNMT